MSARLLTLYRFAHERSRGDRDCAALAFEPEVRHAVALESHGEMQTITAQRVVPVGGGVGGVEPAELTRALVVVENDLAIQILEVHQPTSIDETQYLARLARARRPARRCRTRANSRRRTRAPSPARRRIPSPAWRSDDPCARPLPRRRGWCRDRADVCRRRVNEMTDGLVGRRADDGEARHSQQLCGGAAPAAAARARGCSSMPIESM